MTTMSEIVTILPERSEIFYSDKMVIVVVGIILTFIMCIIGTFGNILSIVVLIKLAINGSRCPLFIILIGLSFSDSAVLLLNFFTNILSIGLPYTNFTGTIPLYLNHGKIIRVFWPLLLGAQMSSIYLTVLVSYERWMAVVKPIKASQRGWSLRKLIVVIGGIISISLVYNIPRWWEYVPKEDNLHEVILLLTPVYFCDKVKYNKTAIEINTQFYSDLLETKCNLTVLSFSKSEIGNSLWYRYGYCATLYILVMFLIPFIMITYMNVALVKCLKKSKEKWGTMSRLQRKEVRLSYVPLAIVALFYLLGLPAVVINFVDSLNVIPQNTGSREFVLWQVALNVSNFFIIVNSSINFLIYCFLGQKFRTTLINLCCCRTDRNHFLSSALENSQPITMARKMNQGTSNKTAHKKPFYSSLKQNSFIFSSKSEF